MGLGRSKYDGVGPLSGSKKVQPSGESEYPRKEGVIAPHSHPREATWRRANLCGLRPAERPPQHQTESRRDIDCERGNQRQCKTAQ